MKPYLYVDGADGLYNSFWFPDNGDNFKDAGPGNLLPLDTALGLAGFSAVGVDISEVGYDDAPDLLVGAATESDGVNAGSYIAEWVGGGSDETVVAGRAYTYGNTETDMRIGGWVFIEASTALDLEIKGHFQDSSSTIAEETNVVTVQPNEWTYVEVVSALTGTEASNAVFVDVEFAANGNQSVGDKLYVGAVVAGSDKWVYPTTPAPVMDLRFTARIFDDGAVLSSRGDTWHIEAVNNGFHVQTGTVATDGTITDHTYTTSTDLYLYDKWYDFRWVHDATTGDHEFYVRGDNGWSLLDSGTVGASAGVRPSAYGIETLSTGLTVGASDMLLNKVELLTAETGWEIFGVTEDATSAEELMGQPIQLGQDASLSGYNHSLYANESGWIINADGVDKGALEVPYRSDFKFGTGDYTIVQRVVGHNEDAFTYSDHDGAGGVQIHTLNNSLTVDSGNVVLSTTSNNLLDGQNRSVLVERESGTEIRLFVDDFETAASMQVDTGANIDNTEDLLLGHGNYADETTFMSGILGPTIIFDRLLDIFEKDSIEGWLESGYVVEEEPDWLRSEAVLYLNPNDPQQQAVYNADSELLNLAIDIPEQLYVRHTFTSDDGVSNPTANSHQLRAWLPTESGPVVHREPLEFFWSDEEQPASAVVPFEDLGPDWINQDWTVVFWLDEFPPSATERSILRQGPLDDTSGWDISYNPLNRIEVTIGGSSPLESSQDVIEGTTAVTVRRSGDTFDVFIGDELDVTQTNAGTVDIAGYDLIYGGSRGLFGPVTIFRRAITDKEVAALYAASEQVDANKFENSIGLDTSFEYQTLNWQLR